MYNPISTLRLSQRAVFRLTVIFIGLLAVFLAIAWMTNSLQLPAFLLPSTSQNIPLSVIIDVEPKNSIVLLNDRPYDPGHMPLPGDYTIKVTHDGYLPVEEEIRIHPNEKNQFIFHLIPTASIVLIARGADFPGWDQQGDLFFLGIPDNTIFKLSGGKSSPVMNVEGEIFQLVYLPSMARVIALVGEGPEAGSILQMFEIETGATFDLEGTGFVNLGSDGETLWGFNYDATSNTDKPIWKLPLNGNQQLVSLDNSQWAKFGEQMVMDASGQWLAIESSKGVAVWEIPSGKLFATFENASTPVWVQMPHPGLAFLKKDHSLYFARADLNWNPVLFLSNIQAPIAELPGGSEIVFTRYNPFEGGTSFWTADTATAGVRLLSEAKTESGKVEEFAMSLDGKKIAFVNQNNILFLVTLEP